MDINQSRTCNLFSLQVLAEYYNASFDELKSYYEELDADATFLPELNNKITACRELHPKGLFLNDYMDTADWFGGQRIVLYVLLRYLKPDLCVETGVFYGGTTSFMLQALSKNGKGRLISLDLPGNNIVDQPRHSLVGDSEIIADGLQTGFIIPEYLKVNWELRLGDSLKLLPQIEGKIDFFCHDSEHSHDFMRQELGLARARMQGQGTLMADDIDWSNGFIEFCSQGRHYPLFLTDNGKNGLKVRLGLTQLEHPFASNQDVTGR